MTKTIFEIRNKTKVNKSLKTLENVFNTNNYILDKVIVWLDMIVELRMQRTFLEITLDYCTVYNQ